MLEPKETHEIVVPQTLDPVETIADLVRQINIQNQRMAEVFYGYAFGDSTNYVQFDSGGNLALHGTARITKYAWIPAQGLAAHGAKAATWVTFANAITSAWQFADNADNAITFNVMTPADMDFTEPSYICLGWSSPVQSGDCYWKGEYIITAVNDDTDGAVEGSSGALYTSSATADGMIKSALITINRDTFDANSLCLHGAITRDISEDALGDVAHLHGLNLMYTAHKLGEAK